MRIGRKVYAVLANRLCQDEQGTGSVQIQEAVIYHKIQRFHDSPQETAGHDSRNNRNKNVAQSLDRLLVEGLLLSRRFLGLLLADTRHPGNGKELVVNLINDARSQDDLRCPDALNTAP